MSKHFFIIDSIFKSNTISIYAGELRHYNINITMKVRNHLMYYTYKINYFLLPSIFISIRSAQIYCS